MSMKYKLNVRRHDLDNLRTFLTCLVILHHTSNCYGGPGGGPYKSALIATAYPSSRLILFAFNAINHSFFMGLFFWISGRVSSQSLKRIDPDPWRSRLSFVSSKFLRLGLPAVCYTMVLEPIAQIIGQPDWNISSIKEFLKGYFAELDGIKGPVWYTANLLLFDIVACLFRDPIAQRLNSSISSGNTSRDDGHRAKPATWYSIARNYGWVAAALTSFLIRVYYPVGTTIKPIALQVAFGPQYVFAYVMGFASVDVEMIFTGPFTRVFTGARSLNKGPEATEDSTPSPETSPNCRGIVWAVLISLLLMPLPLVPRLFGTSAPDMQALEGSGIYGGWNFCSLLYSIWNELSLTLVGPTLAAYFHNWHNAPMRSTFIRPRDSYGAFLVHMVISGMVEKTVDWFLIPSHADSIVPTKSIVWNSCGLVVVAVVVGLINVTASFAVAKAILDRVPFLRLII